MRTRTQLLLLGLILATSLVARLPLLANAEAAFTSDEAVNALAVQHLLQGRELSAFSWDVTYYGMVEGMLAVPFVALLGPTALAFKLSAVTGFLALIVAVFSLGRALYGPAEGLAAAALLIVFSPELVLWSTLAISGFCLIVAWGVLTLLCLLHAIRAPGRWLLAAIGFLAGFGLYIFELYVPYLLLLLLAGAVAFVAPPRSLPSLRLRLARAMLVATGFALGAAPKIALILTGARGEKRPSYAFAGAEHMGSNVRLLLRECIPALFGVDLHPESLTNLGYAPALGWVAAALGALLLLGYAAAWAKALGNVARGASGDPGQRQIEGLLVLLVPLVAVLFVMSPNPQDAGSNRYLLPALGALPLAGGALVRWGRRHFIIPMVAGLIAIGLPAVKTAMWLIDDGYLTPALGIAVKREPLRDVIQFMDSHELVGGYGRYWDAYKATFIAQEKLLFVPYMGWDRYPAYSARLRETDRVAWIFPGERVNLRTAARVEADRLEGWLLNQLAAAGRPHRIVEAGGYRIYSSTNRGTSAAATARSPSGEARRPPGGISGSGRPGAGRGRLRDRRACQRGQSQRRVLVRVRPPAPGGSAPGLGLVQMAGAGRSPHFGGGGALAPSQRHIAGPASRNDRPCAGPPGRRPLRPASHVRPGGRHVVRQRSGELLRSPGRRLRAMTVRHERRT